MTQSDVVTPFDVDGSCTKQFRDCHDARTKPKSENGDPCLQLARALFRKWEIEAGRYGIGLNSQLPRSSPT